MMSMFSSFDMNYHKMSLYLPLIISMIMSKRNQSTYLTKKILSKLNKMMSKFIVSLKKNYMTKMTSYLMTTIMSMLFMMNYWSLHPYILTMSSDMASILSLSMIFWTSMILFQSSSSTKSCFSHLIPTGCPLILSPFLFIVELISNMIRPITMTVRLIANMIAGHVLINLTSTLVCKSNLTFALMMALNMMEVGVSVIQAYIFTVMLTLCYSEVK